MAYSWKGVHGAGEEPQKGDIVRCISTAYVGVRYGDKRVVQGVDDGCVILHNFASPHGTSPYKASSFELVARQGYQHQVGKQETKYMHIAIKQYDGFSFTDLAHQINKNGMDFDMLADTNGAALKQRVQARIEANPDEVWLILGGQTIASGRRRPSVDVSFRSL